MHTNSALRRTRLAAEILAEMGRQRLTRIALSAATGIEYKSICTALRCERPIGVEELDTISTTLGLPLSELIARTDEPVAA